MSRAGLSLKKHTTSSANLQSLAISCRSFTTAATLRLPRSAAAQPRSLFLAPAVGSCKRSLPVYKHFIPHIFAMASASTAREEATMTVEQAVDKVESAKKAAAYKAVEEHFNPSFTHVGIGSGSTVVYVVDAIKEAVQEAGGASNIQFIPTGYQSRQLVVNAGLTPLAFDDLPEGQMIDVAFDGADEVDEDFNCVKGGGACLYQEKLVATRAKTFICVADYRKDVARLLTNWTYVPIEVEPLASKAVIQALKALGSPNPEIRTLVQVKEGPLKTDQGFFIVKAPFPKLLIKSENSEAAEGKTSEGLSGKIWHVEELADEIKKITGVLEVGLFQGVNGPQAKAAGIGAGGQKPIAVYFGMQDGSVKVRKSADI